MAQMVLALADGASCLSDLAALRGQPAVAGPVASEPTVWRTFKRVGPVELGPGVGTGGRRDQAWAAGGPRRRAAGHRHGRHDRDHPGRQGRRRTHLQAHLRSPPVVGHGWRLRRGPRRCGDPATPGRTPQRTTWSSWASQSAPPSCGRPVTRWATILTTLAKELVVRRRRWRTHWLAEECRDCNIGFSLGYASTAAPAAPVYLTPTTTGSRGRADGTARDGAEVVDHRPGSTCPSGRRDPVHRPGRERPLSPVPSSLFDTIRDAPHRVHLRPTTTRHARAVSNANAPEPGTSSGTPKPVGSQPPLRRRRQQRRGCSCASAPTTCSSGPRRSALTRPLRRATPRPSVTGSYTSPPAPPPPTSGSTSTAPGLDHHPPRRPPPPPEPPSHHSTVSSLARPQAAL